MRLIPTGWLRENGDAGVAGRSTARSSPASPLGDRDE